MRNRLLLNPSIKLAVSRWRLCTANTRQNIEDHYYSNSDQHGLDAHAFHLLFKAGTRLSFKHANLKTHNNVRSINHFDLNID